MGRRKGIYYQPTKVIHWNLLRITTANAVIGAIFFIFLSDGIKIRKPVMEENVRLNINIEAHTADLHCLFRYFKNMWPFLRTLVSLNKNIFLLSFCWMEKKLVVSEKGLLFHWWHSPSCIVNFLWYHYELYFPVIAMWHSSSTTVTVKTLVS